MIQSNFPCYHIGTERPAMARAEAAFAELLPALQKKLNGHHVALKDGEVVDHDADRIALVARIAATYPQDLVAIKRVTSEPLRTLRAPTPRRQVS